MTLRGRAAVAQAKLAYHLFCERFADERWPDLAGRGARLQRPLWASTSTKNPTHPDTMYVDNLIGPGTINTLTEATIAVFEDHGTIARTIDRDVDDANAVLNSLAHVGVAMESVGSTLQSDGVASFRESFNHALDTIDTELAELPRH